MEPIQLAGLPESLEQFDELGYLDANEDVAQGVYEGAWESGLEHFRVYGFLENRDPKGGRRTFDEFAYRDCNPDVRRGVEQGSWKSGRAHWVICGRREGRRISPQQARPVQRFLNSLLIDPRIEISATIVTAADAGFFLPLQCFIASLYVSHIAKVVIVDLGLEEYQREWCRRHGAEIMEQPASIPFAPGSIHWWQTWNKSFHMRAVGGRMLYVDPDSIITGPLDWLDRTVAERPVLFSDAIAAHRIGWRDGTACMANQDAYYRDRPVPVRFRPGEHPNGGVIGLDLNRDRDMKILDAWCGAILDAANDETQRAYLAWADQGCLQWALESLGETHVVLCDSRHNETVRADNLKSLDDVIEVVDSLRGTRILHFAGDRKPHQFFPFEFVPTCVGYPENRNDLTLFVLGHERERFKTVPTLPHIRHVFLPDLDESNSLAESRVFLSRLIDDCQSEYVGLCTARWDEKYSDECLPLKDLHRLRMRRDVVWAARPSVADWVERTDDNHRGMAAILRRLATELGVADVRRSAPWSNNFICHADTMTEILAWWRKCWRVIEAEFGRPPRIPYAAPEGTTRHHSYLAERLTMLYFCSRPDLEIRKIPAP